MSRTLKYWLDENGDLRSRKTQSEKPPRKPRNVESIDTVDCFFEVDCVEPDFNTNTVDPDMDIDGSAEFGDHDDATQGLTLVEPDGVLATASFLNGYGVE